MGGGRAGGGGSERIHPRQSKGDRSLLNKLQGSSGQGSKGGTDVGHGVCSCRAEWKSMGTYGIFPIIFHGNLRN